MMIQCKAQPISIKKFPPFAGQKSKAVPRSYPFQIPSTVVVPVAENREEPGNYQLCNHASIFKDRQMAR